MRLTNLILVLGISWIGAAVIAYFVYDWRQDNDIDDLRDKVEELRDDAGLGDDELALEPESRSGGDLTVTIVSVTDDDENIPGIMDVKGSAVVRVENEGQAPGPNGPDIPVFGTAEDGAACQVLKELSGYVLPQAGQHSELTVRWDCENLVSLSILGREFEATR